MKLRSLTLRLLIFNVLLVFFPLGGMLVLDTYEKQLLISMENAMVQQGRIFSAALENRPLAEESSRILRNLRERTDSRIRIVDRNGFLLADSSDPSLYEPGENTLPEEKEVKFRSSRSDEIYETLESSVSDNIRENWLYKTAVYPINIIRRLFLPPAPPMGSAEYYSSSDTLDGTEIRQALQGRYGAKTRYSSGGQRSVTLYSAIPIREGEAIAGAVLISKSTYRILTDLYRLRLDMLRIFLYSLGAAVLLSVLLARRITIPVRNLTKQAEKFLDHKGRVAGEFRRLKSKDEIGELSLSLYTLSGKLEKQMNFIGGFSADITHEMKNPLASIRSAAELAHQDCHDSIRPLIGIIQRESDRMQNLLDDLKDLSRMDVSLEEEERQKVELSSYLTGFLEEWEKHRTGPACILIRSSGDRTFPVWISENRLYQCMSNLLLNAESFSPGEKTIEISLSVRSSMAVIAVKDQGPGITSGSEDKIFSRFYSDREEKERYRHSGLGLSIVRSIVESYGGSIKAANRPGGGACFTLELPMSPEV